VRRSRLSRLQVGSVELSVHLDRFDRAASSNELGNIGVACPGLTLRWVGHAVAPSDEHDHHDK
jgi:hypothetical protein